MTKLTDLTAMATANTQAKEAKVKITEVFTMAPCGGKDGKPLNFKTIKICQRIPCALEEGKRVAINYNMSVKNALAFAQYANDKEFTKALKGYMTANKGQQFI